MSHREPCDIEAELAALADGTLPAARRAELRARVGASPEQSTSLQGQRTALASLRSLEAVQAPASLRRSIEGLASDAAPRQRRARARRGWLAGAGAPHAPTTLQVARVTLEPATLASPAENPHAQGLLESAVEGVPFPYWGGAHGWQTAGARADRLDGRTIATVFYAARDGRRIGYAIVAGQALPTPAGGRTVERGGVRFQVLDTTGATIVTWREAGHTCILAGRGVPADTLLRLVS